jgi:hypothetical protein
VETDAKECAWSACDNRIGYLLVLYFGILSGLVCDNRIGYLLVLYFGILFGLVTICDAYVVLYGPVFRRIVTRWNPVEPTNLTNPVELGVPCEPNPVEPTDPVELGVPCEPNPVELGSCDNRTVEQTRYAPQRHPGRVHSCIAYAL